MIWHYPGSWASIQLNSKYAIQKKFRIIISYIVSNPYEIGTKVQLDYTHFFLFFNLKIKKTYLLLFYFLFIHIPMIKSVLALFDYPLNFWRLYIVCYFEMENNSFSKHEGNRKHGLHGLKTNQTFLASVPSTCM